MTAILIVCLSIFMYELLTQRSPSDCTTNTYFDIAELDCKTCPDNNSYALNSSYCACKDGYKIPTTSYAIGFRIPNLCAACTPAAPCSCSPNQIQLERNMAGEKMLTTVCLSCAPNAYPNKQRTQCIPCSHYGMVFTGSTCNCKLDEFINAGDTCVLKTEVDELPIAKIAAVTDITLASRITLNDQAYFSAFISYNYLKSAVGCYHYLDMVNCQALANMCVFQNYDMTSTVCQLFNETLQTQNMIAQEPGERKNIPWLLYESDSASVYYDNRLQMVVSFDSVDDPSVVHIITYYLAIFKPNGEFVKFKALQSELTLCPNSMADAINAKSFGINMEIQCEIDMSIYINDYQTYLYELFILDVNKEYQPVPVLIGNYLKDDQYPNRGSDINKFKFTRRFYIVDNLATREGDLNDQQSVRILRYPQKVLFDVRLHKVSDERMYMPFVYIDYSEKRVINGQLTDPIASVSFQVQHNFEPINFWKIAQALFITYNCLLLIVVLTRLYTWTKANPRISYKENYFWYLLINIIYIVIDTWNDAMFYFVFAFTGYWFVFYKLQSKIYVLIPKRSDYSNYQPFELVFYWMFGLRMLCVLILIWRQSTINITFIDWESTELQRPIDQDDESYPKKDDEQRRNERKEEEMKAFVERIKSKVSIWRTLLVANEFNELQTERIISKEWTLLFFGLFMIALNWENLAQEQPSMSTNFNYVPSNYVLKYFISQFVYLIIGLVQIILRRLFNIWYPLAVEDFTDLCSVANISIFIIYDNLKGFYVHGENPFGFSEGSAEHLQQCLKNERNNQGKQRGLVDSVGDPQDRELQTFEIYVPIAFRNKFDGAFEKIRDQKQQEEIEKLGLGQLEMQKMNLLLLMKEAIGTIRKKANEFIRTKEPFQRFLGYAPDDLLDPRFIDKPLPVFYRDPDFGFKQIFFCGYEYYFLVTDILLMNFWLIITDNMMVAIILQYASTLILENIKNTLSENNLSDKAKIDSRFLI